MNLHDSSADLHGLLTFGAVPHVSSSSLSNCCFRCRRADFFMARRAAATASFSTCRSFRVRLSMPLGKCETFGRCAPTFRSFGFAYGFMVGTPSGPTLVKRIEKLAICRRFHGLSIGRLG